MDKPDPGVSFYVKADGTTTPFFCLDCVIPCTYPSNESCAMDFHRLESGHICGSSNLEGMVFGVDLQGHQEEPRILGVALF